MDRLNHYRIVKDDADVELHEDLLVAMRRARRLAEREGAVYEIRDEHDFILVVVISSKVEDKGTTMPRAVRHNSRLTLAKMEARTRSCPQGGEHDWHEVRMQGGARFACAKCNVLGYRPTLSANRVVEHRCVTCGKPATVERQKKVPRHRWSCDAHALD